MAVTAVEWVPPILFLKVLLALRYTHADAEGTYNREGGAEALRTRAAESAGDGSDLIQGGSDECGVVLQRGVGGWKQLWKCMMRVPGVVPQDGGEGAADHLPFV